MGLKRTKGKSRRVKPEGEGDQTVSPNSIAYPKAVLLSDGYVTVPPLPVLWAWLHSPPAARRPG